MKLHDIEFSESALETLNALREEAKHDEKKATIFKALIQKIELVKENSRFGNPIAKRLIPKKYAQEDISLIFRVELPLYWRMLYTITNKNTIEIIAIILDIVDHPTYDTLFGYKKK